MSELLSYPVQPIEADGSLPEFARETVYEHVDLTRGCAAVHITDPLDWRPGRALDVVVYAERLGEEGYHTALEGRIRGEYSDAVVTGLAQAALEPTNPEIVSLTKLLNGHR